MQLINSTHQVIIVHICCFCNSKNLDTNGLQCKGIFSCRVQGVKWGVKVGFWVVLSGGSCCSLKGDNWGIFSVICSFFKKQLHTFRDFSLIDTDYSKAKKGRQKTTQTFHFFFERHHRIYVFFRRGKFINSRFQVLFSFSLSIVLHLMRLD